MDIDSNLKLCIDCKHYRRINQSMFLPATHGCNASNLIDLTDGEPVYRQCKTMRNGDCGLDAKLFEPK